MVEQFVPVYFVLIGMSFGAAYGAWQLTRRLKAAAVTRPVLDARAQASGLRQ